MTQDARGRVVILGQGYVGLPVSMRAVEVGYDVVGYDVAKDRVERLRAGQPLDLVPRGGGTTHEPGDLDAVGTQARDERRADQA